MKENVSYGICPDCDNDEEQKKNCSTCNETGKIEIHPTGIQVQGEGN